MSTLYQRNMNQFDPSKIENFFDTVRRCFIPYYEKNPDFKKVEQYCADQGITLMDFDIFTA